MTTLAPAHTQVASGWEYTPLTTVLQRVGLSWARVVFRSSCIRQSTPACLSWNKESPLTVYRLAYPRMPGARLFTHTASNLDCGAHRRLQHVQKYDCLSSLCQRRCGRRFRNKVYRLTLPSNPWMYRDPLLQRCTLLLQHVIDRRCAFEHASDRTSRIASLCRGTLMAFIAWFFLSTLHDTPRSRV